MSLEKKVNKIYEDIKKSEYTKCWPTKENYIIINITPQAIKTCTRTCIFETRIGNIQNIQILVDENQILILFNNSQPKSCSGDNEIETAVKAVKQFIDKFL